MSKIILVKITYVILLKFPFFRGTLSRRIYSFFETEKLKSFFEKGRKANSTSLFLFIYINFVSWISYDNRIYISHTKDIFKYVLTSCLYQFTLYLLHIYICSIYMCMSYIYIIIMWYIWYIYMSNDTIPDSCWLDFSV